MTTTHNFQPGDRVFNHMGKPGTVIPTPADRLAPNWPSSDNVYMILDDMPNFSHANSSTSAIKRQPITVGSFVRELAGQDVWGNTRDRHEVLSMSDDGTRAKFKGFLGGELWVTVDRLASVAAPEPAKDFDPYSGVIFAGIDNAATLKQAREIAQIIHDRHFAENTDWVVSDDLWKVLNQIDNMTSDMVRTPSRSEIEQNEATRANAASYSRQIDYLAAWIMYNVAGEPSMSEGAVECAIRIMRNWRGKLGENATTITQLRRAVADAANILTPDAVTPEMTVNEWLKLNAPEKLPKFKRGDLVTWGQGAFKGRIVTIAENPGPDSEVEVLITDVIGNRAKDSAEYIGRFSKPVFSIMRHITE